MRFTEYDVDASLLTNLAQMGYQEATPVQAAAIGPLLEGRDVVAQARTGSGKTAAFGIPLMQGLYPEGATVQALVLVPTRELAIQVAGVLGHLAAGTETRIVPIYGGAGFEPQVRALKHRGPLVVVATPGRLLDHVEQRTLNLQDVGFLVLDEADRMLDMGFLPDMRRILRQLPQRRQTALFSATIPQAVERLIGDFTHRAQRIQIDSGHAVPEAKQYAADVEKSEKAHQLLHLLVRERPERAIVFTRTKHLAKRLAQRLDGHGWSSVALQGNMTQGQRERALTQFREGGARILVATDVAARGLDVPGITHVVNFDLPDADAYVHRVGRTARNGAKGRAFTFVQGDERRDFAAIQRVAGAPIESLRELGQGTPGRGPDAPRQPEAPKPRQHRGNSARRPRPQNGGGRGRGGNQRWRGRR